MKLWKAILAGACGITKYETFIADSAVQSQIALTLRYTFDVVSRLAMCPLCQTNGITNRDVGRVIAHLNDVHKWSRECIAHWVRSIEDPKPLELEYKGKGRKPKSKCQKPVGELVGAGLH
jgi:hypothetical protein